MFIFKLYTEFFITVKFNNINKQKIMFKNDYQVKLLSVKLITVDTKISP